MGHDNAKIVKAAIFDSIDGEQSFASITTGVESEVEKLSIIIDYCMTKTNFITKN